MLHQSIAYKNGQTPTPDPDTPNMQAHGAAASRTMLSDLSMHGSSGENSESEATSGVLGTAEAGASWAVELTRTAIKMTSVVKTMQPSVCAMRQR